jgi:Domain of unknown function (DUF222)
MWWTPDKGMLHLHGQLPDVMGAQFEATIQQMTDRMRPPKGQPWDTFEHRAADALTALCDRNLAADDDAPTLATKPLLVVQVPQAGPAEVAGIPLPDAMVEQLRANARIEPVLVDNDGMTLAVGTQTTALSPKIMRAVLLRDGHCRFGTCDIRHGLQIHHLRPRSWGGTDDPSNLALVGNPNRPDGLRLARLDHLTDTEREQLGLPAARAGPNAA